MLPQWVAVWHCKQNGTKSTSRRSICPDDEEQSKEEIGKLVIDTSGSMPIHYILW
jgi:hypothetical protein